MTRLRAAWRVAGMLAETQSPKTGQAWFQGANPLLDDVAPARLLREGSPAKAAPRILAAARDFADR